MAYSVEYMRGLQEKYNEFIRGELQGFPSGPNSAKVKYYEHIYNSLYMSLMSALAIIHDPESGIKIHDGLAVVTEGMADDAYTLRSENDECFTFFTKTERKNRFKKIKTADGVSYTRETYFKKRVLTVSKPAMKSVLGILGRMLSSIVESEYVAGYIPDSVHSYRKGKSYATCAAMHAGAYKKTLVTYDISNYFHSITKRMVHHCVDELLNVYFSEENIKKYHAEPMRDIIVELRKWLPSIVASTCTVTAPDGSSDKPVLAMGLEPAGTLANLALLEADRHFDDIFSRTGTIYTRYSDNIILSRAEKFTTEEMKIVPDFISCSDFCTEARPFKINKDKTLLKPRRWRQRVLGAVVNEKLNISKDRTRWIRSLLYHLYNDCVELRGEFDTALCTGEAVPEETKVQLRTKLQKMKRRFRFAQGNVCFIKSLNADKYERYNTWLYASSMLLRSMKGEIGGRAS